MRNTEAIDIMINLVELDKDNSIKIISRWINKQSEIMNNIPSQILDEIVNLNDCDDATLKLRELRRKEFIKESCN